VVFVFTLNDAIWGVSVFSRGEEKTLQFVSFLVLLAFLPFYLWVEYRCARLAYRVVLKTLCSLLFLLTAVLAVFASPVGFSALQMAFLLAFVCSLAGDVLLALPQERNFMPGLVSFFAAQCLFATGLSLRLGFSP
jgi:uncharacterized membrane protein YhhN